MSPEIQNTIHVCTLHDRACSYFGQPCPYCEIERLKKMSCKTCKCGCKMEGSSQSGITAFCVDWEEQP